jgi:MFS family permease
MTEAQDVRDSAAAWRRLAIAVATGTIGSVGMWSFVVALPAVQAEFGVDRADASLPYTLTMAGFAVGAVLMGRLADRFGLLAPLLAGALSLVTGYGLSAIASTLVLFALAQILVGLGASASFAPLMADLSHWFVKRRGVAVAVASSGNYLAGAIWPPILQHFISAQGWRPTYLAVGAFCLLTLIPLAFLLRQRAPVERGAASLATSAGRAAAPMAPAPLLALLLAAGVACCVAMAMPQAHLVAYCAELGYGPARGAQMLSLMLAFGVVSRLISGIVADRIGGLPTLLLGSSLQGVALFLYAMFDGLASLYVISALFGLFQGGIVPMYAVIVREFFPAEKAGSAIGLVVMATLVGMAFGGWVSGAIFDLTGSYQLAFVHGLAWNLLNVAICVFLLWRQGRRAPRLAMA